jgi:hypothetical protein
MGEEAELALDQAYDDWGREEGPLPKLSRIKENRMTNDSQRTRDLILEEFRASLEGFDFCGSPIEDAWCEHVGPRAAEFVSDWLNERGIALVGSEDDLTDLVVDLSGVFLEAFIRYLGYTRNGGESDASVVSGGGDLTPGAGLQ